MKQSALPGMEDRRLRKCDLKRMIADRLHGFSIRQRVRVEIRRQKKARRERVSVRADVVAGSLFDAAEQL